MVMLAQLKADEEAGLVEPTEWTVVEPDEPRPGTPYTVGRTTHIRPGCQSPLSDSATVSGWSTSPRKLSARGTFPFSNTEDRRLAAPKVVSPKTFADLFAH